jgi:hypothetical protein
MMRPCLFGSALGASNASAVEWSGGALPSGCALGCLLWDGAAFGVMIERRKRETRDGYLT